MPLTPLDIHNKEFDRSFRGYSIDQVDEFLDEVNRDYEAALRELNALREQVARLTARVKQYEDLEETLRNTLVMAQKTAEEMRENARREAEVIVREAEQEARDRLRRADEEVAERRRQLEELDHDVEAFRARVRSLLESELAILNGDWGHPWREAAQARREAAAGSTAVDKHESGSL
ncbi:MAG: DivIVA domain-containing protein [Clostridia bacterium]|nr:DivIVA domain-containing protein [Clostridia bacterium]MCL6521994.1 DivIVA domain-containing protein [Bacillota bacterium]